MERNKILDMSNEEAAGVLRHMLVGFNPPRGNGKAKSTLQLIMALNKAIYALETGPDVKVNVVPIQKAGECGCRCISCGRLVKDGKIFPRKYNPKIGICFDCY